jgi:hypothetical protein
VPQVDLKSKCPERERLLGEYKQSAAEYSRTVRALRDSLAAQRIQEIDGVRQSVEKARRDCENARLLFEGHLQKHGC